MLNTSFVPFADGRVDYKINFKPSVEDAVTLLVNNARFLCSKPRLKQLEYFCKLIDGRFQESKQTEIRIEETLEDAFGEFLTFIHKGNVELTTKNVLALYVLSDKYLANELMAQCENYLRKNKVNKCPIEALCYLDNFTDPTIVNNISGIRNNNSLWRQHVQEAIKKNYRDALEILFNKKSYYYYNYNINNDIVGHRKALDLAIEEKNLGLVQFFLDKGIDTSYIFSDNRQQFSPLSFACYLNLTEIAGLIMNKMDKRNYYVRQTLANGFKCVIENNNYELVEMILKIFGDSIITNFGKAKLLKLIVKNQDITLLSLAVQYGLDPVSTSWRSNDGVRAEKNIFIYAAEQGLTQILQALNDFSKGFETMCYDNNLGLKLCPVHIAVIHGHNETALWLFSQTPFILCGNKKNAMHYAILNKNQYLLQEMLQHKEAQKLFTKDVDGRLPIHYAMELGDLEMTRLLIDHGALDQFRYCSDFFDKDNKTPFDLCCDKGYQEFMNTIIRYIIDNRTKYNSNLASHILFWASVRENYSLVKYLVKEKTNVNLNSINGDSFLHWAAKKGRLEAVRFLVENKAIIDHKNEQNRTALHEAAENGHYRVVKFLLRQDSNPGFWDKSGKTALKLAEAQRDKFTRKGEYGGEYSERIKQYDNIIEQLEVAECKVQ